MFTGIIEEIGTINKITNASGTGAKLQINAKKVLQNTKLGDSIAVNGVCLTVTNLTNSSFTADIMPETLRRSNLGFLKPGSKVNLERAMAADGRFGGHIVSGHIDGTGKIVSFLNEGNAIWVQIECDKAILALIVQKGSITIDGISLTVAKIDSASFKVSIIPHTASQTCLIEKKAGDIVNLENDIVAKYVQKLLALPSIYSETDNLDENAKNAQNAFNLNGFTNSISENKSPQGITEEFLKENGF